MQRRSANSLAALPASNSPMSRPSPMRKPLFLVVSPVILLSGPAFAEGDQASPAAAAPEAVNVDLLRVEASGLTADQVARRAAQTSYVAKANEAALQAASARVDVAYAQYFPRLSGTARYTRLSDFTPPALSFGSGGSLVGTPAPAGTLNPSPTVAVALGGISFPLVLNNYLMQASLIVPVSDYFLRISQSYSAATNAQAAARHDVVAARARSAADGRVTFYTWLRARGAYLVTVEALQDQKNHYKDAQNQFNVGNASKADVLRAETGVAAAELQVVRAHNLAELVDKQLRIAMHDSSDRPLAVGESLDAAVAPVQGNLKTLVSEAHSARLEIKSIDASAEAVRQQAVAVKNGGLPQFAAFGDALYANPNQRRFPQTDEWFATWDVGVQLTWSPNDTASAFANARGIDAQVAQIEAQKLSLRDGIELEVTQAYQATLEADQAIASTKRELAAATEAYRVSRELFNAGRATSLVVTDAESGLTRARLDELNAKVDARLSRVRLDHALGRDTAGAIATP